MALGDHKVTTLHFNGPPQRRAGNIRVVMHEPTIDTGRFVRPPVELTRNGRAVQALMPGSNSVDLALGSYEIAIQSLPSRSLPLKVGPTGDQFQATVDITPGWFEAQNQQTGVFVLSDAAGNAIAQFRGKHVAQSLADGSYKLEFIGGDKTRLRSDFTISTGHYTAVTLR